jgi:hypothetical protein
MATKTNSKTGGKTVAKRRGGGAPFWDSSGLFAALGFAFTVAATIVGVIVHAYLLSYRVDALEHDQASNVVAQKAQDQRMDGIQAQVNANQAAADKRESLLESSLREITVKLDTVQTTLNNLPRR